MKKILTTIFIFIFFISFSYSHAQMQGSFDGVDMSVNPITPSQGSSVTVSIESYTSDLDSAAIVWSLNGKAIANGVGMKKFNFIAPKTGVVSTVMAIIKLSSGREIKKTISIKSGSVEIVWESMGYTPPFFKGRNLFVYQNTVRFVAVPHLSSDGKVEIKPSDLIYKWRLGGKYVDGGNGQGKQSIEVAADEIPKTLEVSVEVYGRDQKESVIGSINIAPTEPSSNFYEMSPLYGIMFNKALVGSVDLSGQEISIFAAPYGFNQKEGANSLEYVWSVNNTEQQDLIKNQSITLKTNSEESGSSLVSLSIRSLQSIMQGVDNSLYVNFKKTKK